MNKKQCVLWICLACMSSVLFASKKQQVQQELSQVNTKLGRLEKTISEAIRRRETLYETLSKTEKAIGQQVHSLHTATQEVQKKQQEIQRISETLNQLNDKLHEKQSALVTHLRLRYQMGEAHPVQWLFNQENLNTLGRLAVYYQYLIHADTHLIQQIRLTKQDIEDNKNKLSSELTTLKTLQHTIVTQQQKLAETKQQHQQVIHTLNQTIDSKQQILTHYKQSQARLQTLIDQLSRAPIITRTQTLVRTQTDSAQITPLQLKGKFSSPLKGQHHRGKPLNHGMLFVAQEGTSVNAVLPGKVVFSDWLNGYGLLLIIDHGDGMMSLYAHNESLFKSRGAIVKSGDQIATVGHTGGIRENGLYFELRRRGKVIPPRQWLA